MLNLALKYLAQGFSLFPFIIGKGLDAEGKKAKSNFPVDWGQYQKRFPTVEEIKAWWKQNPNYSVGIVTGAISNITVIDFDKKTGGLETLKTLKLPPTLVVKTGGGGFHYYYKFVEGSANKEEMLPGVDLRSEGGFVVAPGAIHQNGQKYEAVMDFDKEMIADFPLDVIKLESLKKKSLTGEEWKKIIKDGVMVGSRNGTLTRVAGLLFNRIERNKWGMVKELCFMWAKYRCKPPLSEEEINKTILSIANRQLAKEEEKMYEIKNGVHILKEDFIKGLNKRV